MIGLVVQMILFSPEKSKLSQTLSFFRLTCFSEPVNSSLVALIIQYPSVIPDPLPRAAKLLFLHLLLSQHCCQDGQALCKGVCCDHGAANEAVQASAG